MNYSGVSGLQLLVLQPTPFCNLNCSYCYLPDRSNRARMDERTLDSVGRHVLANPVFTDASTLVWHAGEPLVLAPEWYRRARQVLETAGGRKISKQSFQTNATLIDERWIDYFSEPGVSVGVSLDGHEEINDAYRLDRKGRGTWRTVMKGINKLHDADVPFHIICVVTRRALDSPKRLAEALIAAGPTSVGLNIEEIDGINETSSLLDGNHEDKIRRFLDEFLDVFDRHADPPRLRERDILNNLLLVKRNGQAIKNQENSPGAILSISATGDISTYSPELMGTKSTEYENFVFGNINEISDLSDIYLNRNFLRCQRAISAGISQCQRSCGYFPLCGGGTPANKYGETKRLDVTETAFCRTSVKTVLDTLVNRNIAQAKQSEIG